MRVSRGGGEGGGKGEIKSRLGVGVAGEGG